MNTLHDSLKLIVPRLPRWMVDDASASFLAKIAGHLPPVHYAGFEYRLGGINEGLDLQQGLNLNESNRRQINRLAQQHPSVTIDTLLTVFNAWSGSDPLQRSFSQVWLEFDQLQDTALPPGLFLTLMPGADPRTLIPALQALRTRLTILGESGRGWLELDKLIRHPDDLPDITHLGFMLSRPDSGIRVVRQLGSDLATPADIEDTELKKSAQQIHQLIRPVLPYFSDFRWCQDLGGDHPGPASIECFFPEPDQQESIIKILDWLLANELCTNRERDALEGWSAILTPETLADAWPQSLIFESLGRGYDEFSAIECKLGHIKLSAATGKPVSAKMYFGYLNRWLRAGD